MKKSETIKLVQECVSSVFSKEDVIKLINKIEGATEAALDFRALPGFVLHEYV